MSKIAGSFIVFWLSLSIIAMGQENRHKSTIMLIDPENRDQVRAMTWIDNQEGDEPGVENSSRNAELDRGKVLLAKGLIAESIPELERAWQNDDDVKDSSDAYFLLAMAYRYAGRHEDALQAIEASIACDPSDLALWAERSNILAVLADKKPATLSPPWVPLAPEPKYLQRVLALGPLEGWNKERVPEIARIYIRYAVALDRAGWRNAVKSFIDVALASALGPTFETCNTRDATACLSELAALMNTSSFSQMPAEVRSYVLWISARKQLTLRNYLHSIEAIQDLVDLGGAFLPNINLGNRLDGLVREVQREAFVMVSFDPVTGIPRSHDPDNFISGYDLSTREELAYEREETLRRQHDPSFRYQMTGDDEDWVGIFEAELKSNKKPVRRRLLSLLATRIQEGKFELPVKFLLHQYAETVMDWPISSKDDTLRKRLYKALLQAAPGDVPESIALGYQVAARLEKLREFWSMRRQEKVVP